VTGCKVFIVPLPDEYCDGLGIIMWVRIKNQVFMNPSAFFDVALYTQANKTNGLDGIVIRNNIAAVVKI